MKHILLTLSITLLFIGCTTEEKVSFDTMPKTELVKSSFKKLPNWEVENYEDALNSFINSCKTNKTKKIYNSLCQSASTSKDAKEFFLKEFDVYSVKSSNDKKDGLLTGYYEPSLKGSMQREEPYIYPIYNTPDDLISVNLSSIYPDLKNYRLRGRLEGKKLVPYYTREQMQEKPIDAEIICYTDSKIDLFFLEVQGSGRVKLDGGESLYIGYDNQNGHRYNSIGKYLVKIGEIPLKDISLQTISAWLKQNPTRVDEVLNYNSSVVYFKQKTQAATGSLGLVLTAGRSVAVDRSYIPLGTMLYMDATIDKRVVSRVVMAQDTGGAIKGAVRADMFFGSTKNAKKYAGELKSPLKLWIFLPKDRV